MKTLACRVGPWGEHRFRRKPVVARRGRLCIVREQDGRYSVMHSPTGLVAHPNLSDLRLRAARVALALCAPLCSWDWSDPDYIKDMDWSHKASLWEALDSIYRMATE
jgi:hypothetical protein